MSLYNEFKQQIVEKLDELDDITDQQRQIMEMRLGINFDSPKTLQEVGDHFGLSPEDIYLIEKDILSR